MTRLSVGAVLARSLRIWLRNLPSFLLLTLIVTLPGHLLRFAVASHRLSFDDPVLDRLLPILVEGTLLYFAAGALPWGVVHELRGKPLGFTRGFAAGLGQLRAALPVGLIMGLVIQLSLLALVLPGLLLLSILFVVMPAAVIEKRGAAAAMQRSALLTSGHRLEIFAVVLLLFACTLAAAIAAGQTLGEDGMGFWAAHAVIALVFGSFSAVTSAVAYHDLRLGKEGASADDLDDVFD